MKKKTSTSNTATESCLLFSRLSTSDERGEEGGEEILSSTLAKVWTLADREIYEQQLEHLHNQLEAALIDNQELKSKIPHMTNAEHYLGVSLNKHESNWSMKAL